MDKPMVLSQSSKYRGHYIDAQRKQNGKYSISVADSKWAIRDRLWEAHGFETIEAASEAAMDAINEALDS